MLCTVFIEKEDDTYIAKEPRTCVTDQGATIEEALSNLKKALELYYEDTDISENTVSPVLTASLEVCV